jgi:hypothetical protein
MTDHLITAAETSASSSNRHPLLSARLVRTEYAQFNLRKKRVELDAATVLLIKLASGELTLEELGRHVGLSPTGALQVGQQLMERGYLTRAPAVSPTWHDPLSPELRAAVRSLRPILVRFAGEEAAFTLEIDAPFCKDLADLVVYARRRFLDAKVRDQFMAAIMSELREPQNTRPPR